MFQQTCPRGRAAQTCKTCDVNQDAPGGNPRRNSGTNISRDSQNNSKEEPHVESTIVIQRFQQILPGSPQYSSKGRLTFSLANLWVVLANFEGILGIFWATLKVFWVFSPPVFFPSLLGRASHREPATEIVRWGVGWRRRALVREGNSPLDPGVTPRSIQSGSHLDPRGAL